MYAQPNLDQTKSQMNLRQLLARSGKTCTEVGFRCSITEQTVRNWVKGKYLPRLDIVTLNTLISVLGCSFEELYAAVLETQEEKKAKSEEGKEIPDLTLSVS